MLSEAGSWRMTKGGWLEWWFIKSGLSFGFLYGLQVYRMSSQILSLRSLSLVCLRSYFQCNNLIFHQTDE